MLKTLTLSLSFGFALFLSSASQAGVLGHGDSGCATCGLASPQGGPIASAQGPIATSCDTPCAKPKCSLFSGLGHKFDGMGCKLKSMIPTHTTSYEWVLKKKHVWGHKPKCGAPSCDTCGTGSVYPTSQIAPSAQIAPSGQYVAPSAAPQAYGASQAYGAGQAFRLGNKTAPTVASVPAELTPGIPTGEEAPPAPEVGK